MNDVYDLERFLQGQKSSYASALSELRQGQKRGHWMWFVFPQIDGLASSSMSKHYAIKSLEEANAYLAHPMLGPCLIECAEAVVGVQNRSAWQIFGSPDDQKLRSCMTLFAQVSAPGSVFERVLEKYYASVGDSKTLKLLGSTETEI